MARTGKKRSDMPAMVTRLPEPTIYDYDPIRLHVASTPKLAAGQPRKLEPSRPMLTEIVTEPCWTGVCPGCGKDLISATTHWSKRPGHHYCTHACRAAHGG